MHNIRPIEIVQLIILGLIFVLLVVRARLRRSMKNDRVIRGEDARKFLESLKINEPISFERQQWMDECVSQSKIADGSVKT